MAGSRQGPVRRRGLHAYGRRGGAGGKRGPGKRFKGPPPQEHDGYVTVRRKLPRCFIFQCKVDEPPKDRAHRGAARDGDASRGKPDDALVYFRVASIVPVQVALRVTCV